MIVYRKNKLGISILLAAMMLYGNSSCQKVEKMESVPSAVSNQGDVSKAVLECLTASDPWLIGGDSDKFKRQFCKLIYGYIIESIRSEPYSELGGPIIGLESFRGFLVSRGVRLKIKGTNSSDTSGAERGGNATGAITYVLEDIIEGEDSSPAKNLKENVLLIGFDTLVQGQQWHPL